MGNSSMLCVWVQCVHTIHYIPMLFCTSCVTDSSSISSAVGISISSVSWSVSLSLMTSNTNFTILDTLVFVNPLQQGRFVAGRLWGESLLHLFVTLLAGLLVESCKVVTGCWWEAALVTALVWDDLLRSFLAAALLFWRFIVTNNLFYYQRMALGYVYCCVCIILSIACGLFLQLLLWLIDPFYFWLIACLHECNINYV